MCRWMLANLARGTLDNRRFLREGTYQALWRPVADVVQSDDPIDQEMCRGWFRGTHREQPVIHHGGSDPGYWADLMLLPERDIGLVAMSNVFCATAWGVADAAFDITIGLEPTMPKRPITEPVCAVLQSAGQDAAIAEYRRLQADAPDGYAFDEYYFSHAAGSAVWVRRPDAVLPVLHLRAALFPHSSQAYEELGEAYLVSGDLVAAERYLQRALTLEPDSDSIPKLIERLNC